MESLVVVWSEMGMRVLRRRIDVGCFCETYVLLQSVSNLCVRTHECASRLHRG